MDYTDNADINHTLDENENIESSRKYEKKIPSIRKKYVIKFILIFHVFLISGLSPDFFGFRV